MLLGIYSLSIASLVPSLEATLFHATYTQSSMLPIIMGLASI